MPHGRVRVYVVWAPLFDTESSPPSSAVQARIHEDRVKAFWDPKKGVGAAVRAAARAKVHGFSRFAAGGRTPYDVIALFPTGARWKARLPPAIYCGSPVESSIGELRRALGHAPPKAAAR